MINNNTDVEIESILTFQNKTTTNGPVNVSGVIGEDTTWSQENSPYIVTGNILVPSGIVLTIEPGVIVKFNEDLYIKVEGTIKAVGTLSEKIIFESNNSNQNKSDWSGIRIRPSSSTSTDGNQDYSSGSQFKYVTIKYADIGLYVYDTSLHTSYTTFENNNIGFEIRKTDGVVIDSSTFQNNNLGIWSEYETFSPDDTTGNISNTYIRNSTFSNNGIAIDLIINQRYFENLKIYNNVVKENTIGIDFSGGGYGCRVISVDIYKNIIVDNTQYGLRVGQIYGYGSDFGSEPDGESPLKFYDNKVINNSIYWDYGGGISGVTTKIFNNIIYNPRSDDNSYSHGIYFDGGTSKNDTITNNLIVSNSKALSFRDRNYEASNKHISKNTIIGTPLGDNSLIESFGLDNKFINNNLIKGESNYTLKNDDSNSIIAENNYWGTINESEIQTLIYDYYDDFELGEIDYYPYLNTLNIDAPISPPMNVTKTVQGNDVVLTWLSNSESDLVGYKLYYGNPTGYSYDNSIDIGNVTTYTISDGDINSEFAITSYDNSFDGMDDQVDGNESWFSVSVNEDSLGLKDFIGIGGISIYPNPTNNILNIDFSDYKSSELFSIDGKSVLKSTLKQIDLSKEVKGIYFLVIEDINGVKSNGIKVIKE